MRFSEIGLIAACSHSKSRQIHPRLRARSLRARTTERRAEEWIERVVSVPGEMRAFSMYCGVYWSGVANLWRKAASRQGDAPLWILSAGYGLIPSDAVIAPYTATLTRNDPDSVAAATGADEIKSWWEAIANWAGPSRGEARTLQELVEAYPKTLWIVVGGSRYMEAIADQLEATQIADGHAHRFVLVSPGLAGRSMQPGIAKSLLKADSRWEALLGRGKVALGVRIATHMFDRADGRPEAIASARLSMEQESHSIKRLKAPERASRSDDEIRRHLRKALGKQPNASFSRALRDFRDSGLACEYTRFRGLYHEVRGVVNGKV